MRRMAVPAIVGRENEGGIGTLAREIEDRLRLELSEDPNIGEVRMFGGLCFMLNGNMLVCSTRKGNLLARIGPGAFENAVAKPGVAPMIMAGRQMKDYVEVDLSVLDDKTLREWVALATSFVGPMPVKEPKPKKPVKSKQIRS